MEKLKEMANVVNKKILRRIEILHPQQSRETKLYQLYSGIHDDIFTSDDEAALALYQSNSKDPRYQKLKNRLYDRLMNTVLFADGPKSMFSKVDRMKIKCRRNLLVTYILALAYARKSAIQVARRGFLLAERYEMMPEAIEYCSILSNIYMILGNKKMVIHFNKKKKTYLQYLVNEEQARTYFTSFLVNYIVTRGKDPKLIEQLTEYCEFLEPQLSKPNSSGFFHLAYRIINYKHELTHNYEAAYKSIHRGLAYFKKIGYNRSAITVLTYELLKNCIRLKKYEEGLEAGEASMATTLEGGTNWYGTLFHYILLHLYAGWYQKAWDLWEPALQRKSFTKGTRSIRELWEVLGAYMHYLLAIGRIQHSDEKNQLKKFRLNKFLNDVPLYTQDKARRNIPLLVIQILFLLQQKKYGEISDRIEALNAYCYRYLRKDTTYRANCFIKMLICLPKAQFHKAGVLRQAKKFHQRLLASADNNIPVDIDMEILPFEALWDIVIEQLDNRFH